MKTFNDYNMIEIIGLGDNVDTILASSFLAGILEYKGKEVLRVNFNLKYLFDTSNFKVRSDRFYVFLNTPLRVFEEENVLIFSNIGGSFKDLPNYRTKIHMAGDKYLLAQRVLEELYATGMLGKPEPRWFQDRVDEYQYIISNKHNHDILVRYIEKNGLWRISEIIADYFSGKSDTLCVKQESEQDDVVAKNPVLETILGNASPLVCEELCGSLIILSGLDSEIFCAVNDIWNGKSKYATELIARSQFVVVVNPVNGSVNYLVRSPFANDKRLRSFLNTPQLPPSYCSIVENTLNHWMNEV